MKNRVLAVLSGALLLLQPFGVLARQGSAPPEKAKPAASRKRVVGGRRTGGTRQSAAREQAGGGADKFQPVAVLNRPLVDYLSGEASVVVNPKQPTVVRIGLAQNATSVIEFPASDRIFYHHEGNDKLVTVFESPTMATDHFITLYPGVAFVAPSEEARKDGARAPSTTITLQMTSGLVLILEIVPVDDISRNAHRCVLNYNRDEVVAARRAAGLAVNLDANDPATPLTNATTKRVGPAAQAGNTPSNVSLPPPVLADVDSTKADSNRRKGRKPENSSDAANKELVSAVKSPDKYFKSWSAASHGISISLSQAKDVDDRSRVVVVAVKNVSTGPVRLVPGTPDLFIQITDNTGTPLRTDSVNRLHLESTALGGRIPAGQVVYYAIVYETPILGSHEKLRVSVSQTEAADDSVTAEMSSASN